MLINKILAIYLGPSGYALVGNFQNFIQIFYGLVGGFYNSALVTLTATLDQEEDRLAGIWKTSGSLGLIMSVLTAVLIIPNSGKLASIFLGDEIYGDAFVWFASLFSLFVFNAMLMAILNGKREYVIFVICNIAGSCVMLVVLSALTIKFGAYGTLIALGVSQSLTCLITLLVVRNQNWLSLRFLFGCLDKYSIYRLGRYLPIVASSALCVPLSQLIVRSQIVQVHGLEAAGLWEAMWRLSAAIMLLLTGSFGLYLLPKLASIQDKRDLKPELMLLLKYIVPITTFVLLSVFTFREQIIGILFSNEFAVIEAFFYFQLPGDAIRVVSWVFAYVLLSKELVSRYVLAEFSYAFAFILLSNLCVNEFGLEGVGVAHLLSFSLYLCLVVYLALSAPSYMFNNKEITR